MQKMKNRQIDDHKKRASRLKQVRRLLNMDRDEFAKYCDYNFVTYKDWETARRNTIPTAKAITLFEQLKTEGVFVDLDWFLYGLGNEPYKSITKFQSGQSIDDLQLHDKAIQEELSVFLSNNLDAVWLMLPDNSMAPFYKKNDIVAGIKFCGDEINKLIGKDCIVQLDNQQLLRKIQSGREQGVYTLVANNADEGGQQIVYDVSLKYAAPVVWLRRKGVVF